MFSKYQIGSYHLWVGILPELLRVMLHASGRVAIAECYFFVWQITHSAAALCSKIIANIYKYIIKCILSIQ